MSRTFARLASEISLFRCVSFGIWRPYRYAIPPQLSRLTTSSSARLGVCREQPRGRRATKERDELACPSAERIAHLSTAGDRCAAGFQSDLCPLWVSRDRCGRSHASVHVRFAPESGQNGPTSWDVRFVPKIYACSLSLRGEDRFRDHAVNPLGAVDHLGDVIIDGYARDHVGLLAS